MSPPIAQLNYWLSKHFSSRVHVGDDEHPNQHLDWVGVFYAGLKVRGLASNPANNVKKDSPSPNQPFNSAQP